MYDYDVFVSYAAADASVVRSLVRELTAGGLRVFWSDAALRERLGEAWYDVIESSLQSSRHMVVAWSTAAKESKWVNREYQAFYSNCFEAGKRRLIPLLLAGMGTTDLPIFLRQLQVFGVSKGEDRRQLMQLLGGKDIQDLSEENERLRRQISELSQPLQPPYDDNEFGSRDARNESSRSTTTGMSYFQARFGSDSKRIRYALARYVAQNYLSPGDSIILDSGASCAAVAAEIAKQSDDNPGLHYTIMTHNYAAYESLVSYVPRERLTLFFAGGRYDQDLKAVLGWPTLRTYEEFNASVTILSASGLVPGEGVFTHGNTEEHDIKRLLFGKATTRRVLILGSSKIGKRDSLLITKTDTMREGAEQYVLVTNKVSAELAGTEQSSMAQRLEQMVAAQGMSLVVVDDEKET
ncbi:MAG: TIR domain-containing protein [Deltaproteobacteria bacterium]|nr:TIR domain-containing protein [Deltaproteobacteria bacterium]